MSTKETSFLDRFTKTVFGCLYSIIFGFTTKFDFHFKPLLSFHPTLASLLPQYCVITPLYFGEGPGVRSPPKTTALNGTFGNPRNIFD